MKRVSTAVVRRMVELRQKGASYSEILLEVKVAQGTVHRYVSKVPILPRYLPVWEKKRGGSKLKAENRKREALEEARAVLDVLDHKNWLVALTALYWAEGTKKDLSFSNTDGEMVKFFVEGLERAFGIRKDELRITIRTYEDLDKQKCIDYWSKKLSVSESQILNVNVLIGKKQGKLNYGMCRVRITKGGKVLNKLRAYAQVLAQHASPHSLRDKARAS